MAHPIVHVYAVCYNEELLLPYFLRHYETVAEKIVVFDGASTDRSVEILKDHPKVVLEHGSADFPTHADRKYNEPVLMKIRNEAYKRSRGKADLVMVVDIDEIVYHVDLRGRLAALLTEGAKVIQVAGFEMVSMSPPSGDTQIYFEISSGFQNHRYNKATIFRPDIDIKYHFGCHDQDVEVPIVGHASSGIKLLHYRFLGPRHFADKYGKRLGRFHSESLEKKWGTHLCVPTDAPARLLVNASETELQKMFWDVLSDQEIEEVIR